MKVLIMSLLVMLTVVSCGDENRQMNLDGKYTEYNSDGSINYIVYRKDAKMHREDGSAFTVYNDEEIRSEAYYVNGTPSRASGPARIDYYDDGTVEKETFFVGGSKTKEVNFDENGNETSTVNF